MHVGNPSFRFPIPLQHLHLLLKQFPLFLEQRPRLFHNAQPRSCFVDQELCGAGGLAGDNGGSYSLDGVVPGGELEGDELVKMACCVFGQSRSGFGLVLLAIKS